MHWEAFGKNYVNDYYSCRAASFLIASPLKGRVPFCNENVRNPPKRRLLPPLEVEVYPIPELKNVYKNKRLSYKKKPGTVMGSRDKLDARAFLIHTNFFYNKDILRETFKFYI